MTLSKPNPYLVPLHANKEKQRYAMEKQLRGDVARRRKLARHVVEEKARRLLTINQSEHFGDFQSMWHTLLENYRMVCFSSDPQSILMWSYYAAGHTGLSIHFDATRIPWGTAQRVHYSTEYPRVTIPFQNLTPDAIARACILTKSQQWEHEKEYRLINYPATLAYSSPKILDVCMEWKSERIAVIPEGSITGVTLGARMHEMDKQRLVRLCRSEGIPVHMAKTHHSEFAVDTAFDETLGLSGG